MASNQEPEIGALKASCEARDIAPVCGPGPPAFGSIDRDGVWRVINLLGIWQLFFTLGLAAADSPAKAGKRMKSRFGSVCGWSGLGVKKAARDGRTVVFIDGLVRVIGTIGCGPRPERSEDDAAIGVRFIINRRK